MQTVVKIVHVNDEGSTVVDVGVDVGDVALKKVLSKFNVTDDQRVTIVKTLFAALIQCMIDHQKDTVENEKDLLLKNARMRAASIAITQIELVQMPTVKAFFAQA